METYSKNMLGYMVLVLTVVGATAKPRDTRSGEDVYVWCDGHPADIFFLVDSSTSIWIKHFRMQRAFLQDLVKNFPIGPTTMRVGLAVFSHRYYRVIGMDQYNNTEDLQDAIGRVPHIYGSTWTGVALKKLRTEEFPNARKNVTKIAVVLTDGVSYDERETVKQAELLKKSGVFVFAVGIGRGPDVEELRKIGSSPSDKFVFEVSGFKVLNEIRESLAYKACRVTPEQVLPYCASKRPIDVMFGFNSAAMGTYRSAHVRNLVVNVTGYFGNMDDGTMQAGLMCGQFTARDIFLNDHQSKNDLIADIRNVSAGSLSAIFEDVKDVSYTETFGGRESSRKVTVLFIDETTEDLDKITAQIVQARSGRIEVFVVAIGDDLHLDDLADVLDEPRERHLVTVSRHEDLDTIHETYSDMICACVEEEPTPPPPV